MSAEEKYDSVALLRTVAYSPEFLHYIIAVGIFACQDSHIRGLFEQYITESLGVFSRLCQVSLLYVVARHPGHKRIRTGISYRCAERHYQA